MIDGKLCNREANIKASIEQLSRSGDTNVELCIRPLYPSHNGCHVSLGAAPRDGHDYARGGVSLGSKDTHPL